jgi:NAD(P)-dependent dehydrogenase (short-subunit alcohol dehydrogenase family)
MKFFKGRTAVITGAGSGFGLEVARVAAREGMNLVLADVQADALDRTSQEMHALGAPFIAQRVDVSKAGDVDALGAATKARFGTPHFVFNNAGVGTSGLIWEQTPQEWDWVIGVNLMGVAHGVRVFTPLMLEAAAADPSYEGHVVNTASMAGLVCAPNMGVYNASKHAVVALSESLFQDLSLVTQQLSASVLCPYFVPTRIHESQRNKPSGVHAQPLTKSQQIARAMGEKAVLSGKVSAEQVAGLVFDALREKRFYIYSHPQALKGVQTRLEDVVQGRNPSDPYADRPELGAQLRQALRS